MLLVFLGPFPSIGVGEFVIMGTRDEVEGIILPHDMYWFPGLLIIVPEYLDLPFQMVVLSIQDLEHPILMTILKFPVHSLDDLVIGKHFFPSIPELYRLLVVS